MTGAIFALYLWTAVASGVAGTARFSLTQYDWRYAGDFSGEAACKAGAAQLGLNDARWRCINTGRRQ